jgi:uncharacterized RDD family membrane protein YckC
MRFDEVELQSVPMPDPSIAPPVPHSRETPIAVEAAAAAAPRFRRALALLTDVSLFVALALALSPLLPAKTDSWAVFALAGFVIMTSYYYFVGSWLLWGKTIGGAIFDVRVVAKSYAAMSLGSASMRWAGILASLFIGGLGFVLAALPDRLSLPDRMSRTMCVTQ